MSLAEAQFYARVYDPARKGSLAELRRCGCEEQEAEELFAAAYAKVMESVNPLERDFSAPQMVRFVKRACRHRLIDERRRPRQEQSAAEPSRLPESLGESPAELAEEREAVAIGREALAMLPERDRLIFACRHLRGLAPEEIVAEVPGLSMRTYRKIMQRAGARVLDAFERIEAGQRCAEMEGGLLRRYVAGGSSAQEGRAVEAHLAHCRACRRARARMQDYLLDLAAGVLSAASFGAARRGAAMSARLLELASQGVQTLDGAGRLVRERLREVLPRLAGSLPGCGTDAGVSQALGISSWRIASICAAGIAAGACAATGVVPGIGGVELSAHHHRPAAPVERETSTPSPPRAAEASRYATPVPGKPNSGPAGSGSSVKKRPVSAKGTVTARREARPRLREGSTVEVSTSSRQVGAEFGPESGRPIPSSGSSAASSPDPSVSGAGMAKRDAGSGGGSSSSTRSNSEFGL